jgi:lipopolysaccharide export system protein LptA
MPKLLHPTFLSALVFLLWAFSLIGTNALWSQDSDSSVGSGEKKEALNTQGPISISADHMTADDSKRLIVFSGRVVARQGDLIISCDSMRVSYQPAGSYISPGSSQETKASGDSETEKDSLTPEATPASASETPSVASAEPASPGLASLSGGQEIDQVECEGAVKIQEGERLAVAEKALYLAKALPRRLVLTGNARVWQGANSIVGHQITYYLDENRSLVDSVGSQRVRAFYDQGGGGN